MSTAPHDAVPVVLPDPDPDVEPEPALGAVVEQGRGSLPYALIHGEALVACASWALGDAGITAVDLGTGWAGVADAGEPFVLHDALCPMTPASFLAACVRAAVERDAVVVGVTGGSEGRPDAASPVVLPAAVVAQVALGSFGDSPSGLVDDGDLDALVTALETHHEVVRVRAPTAGRRVTTREDVVLLERETRPASAEG
ncbi:hypothetical protein [Nocardioides sp. Leaf285]|uniref:hypothetical protein n=1 Tax=Nocardioides sp. Leaf285 TaxID=1736322 RepID=UPI0007027E54|nr:hypothetical protein [Nocardioides sp. Leaf285]KQP65713.1 hypothetical protein ASF47_08190 [Nocardioides sp. Leaf285]